MRITNHFRERMLERGLSIETPKRIIPCSGHDYKLKKQSRNYTAFCECENSKMICQVNKDLELVKGITIYK